MRAPSRASAKTLLSLIDEVLDFSKIEAGKIELRPAPFEIADAAQGVIELLAPRARDKGLEIGWLAAPELPRTVIGDEMRRPPDPDESDGQRHQVHRSRRRGPHAATRSRRATPCGQTMLRFAVRDTGPGVPPMPSTASSPSSSRRSRDRRGGMAAPGSGSPSPNAWSMRWAAASAWRACRARAPLSPSISLSPCRRGVAALGAAWPKPAAARRCSSCSTARSKRASSAICWWHGSLGRSRPAQGREAHRRQRRRERRALHRAADRRSGVQAGGPAHGLLGRDVTSSRPARRC